MNKFLWFAGGAAACFGGLTIYGLYRVAHGTNNNGGGKGNNDKTPKTDANATKTDFYGGIGATKKQPSNIF